jgi:hypothetical protein
MPDIAAVPGTAQVKSESAPPSALAPQGAVAPYGALRHAMKRQAVQGAWATRTAEAGFATVKLIASGQAYDLPSELLRMQQAALKQLCQMGQDWLRGLDAWTSECTVIKPANTMSKIVGQEFNLIGQFGQLLSDQATDLVNLMERVQVGYGYWVQEKLEAGTVGLDVAELRSDTPPPSPIHMRPQDP